MKMGVVGCAGRMGQALLRQIDATEGCTVVGGIERPGHDAIGADLGALAGLAPLDIAVGDDAGALFAASDVVLDFTAPAATVANAKLAAETGKGLVAGTTGLEPDQEAAIAEAAKKAPIMRAANMSVGVNLLINLVREVAAKLDPDWDIEVVEMHHKHKVDAPSGTALTLGRAAADGRGVDHDKVAARGRDGITGERGRGDIGYAVMRGGNVAGEHSVMFAAENERVVISHLATDRAIFARGGVTAARWLAGKPAGLYDMNDVLGF
ncbi:MAG: 4-hydroxy-tetrahydrodipicolinate reductase [Alphaproteobacteria bacterium]